MNYEKNPKCFKKKHVWSKVTVLRWDLFFVVKIFALWTSVHLLICQYTSGQRPFDIWLPCPRFLRNIHLKTVAPITFIRNNCKCGSKGRVKAHNSSKLQFHKNSSSKLLVITGSEPATRGYFGNLSFTVYDIIIITHFDSYSGSLPLISYPWGNKPRRGFDGVTTL